MKNIALIISNKDCLKAEYFFDTLCTHKNIQKINLFNYDKIEKLFQTKSIKSDYLKSPKYFCEKLVYNHQLSFKPFLNYFFYFFIIEKPRNIVKNKSDSTYYCLRLRRMYEMISKCKNKMILFDNDVYKEECYKKSFSFLGLDQKFKKKQIPEEFEGIFDEETEEFYEKYRYKIINNFIV